MYSFLKIAVQSYFQYFNFVVSCANSSTLNRDDIIWVQNKNPVVHRKMGISYTVTATGCNSNINVSDSRFELPTDINF